MVFKDQILFPLGLAKISELQQDDKQLTRMLSHREGAKMLKKETCQENEMWKSTYGGVSFAVCYT